jgi:alpha/beta superfamily hydrolase
MAMESLSIDGPAGRLDARWQQATDDGARVAVVCHPHPQHGGTMDNKVVTTVARAFHLHGLHVLRFNFRGVGLSEGTYGEGVGEEQDLRAVVEHLRDAGHEHVQLAGFSFGAGISIRMARALGVEALISVAPPVPRFDLAAADTPQCPWLVIQGDDDELVDAEAVSGWVDGLTHRPELIRLPEVDHFFHGKLTLLRETVLATLEAWDDQEAG